MSEVPTIYERMVAILADLPAIGKDQKNAQQGFMFRGHDDVLNALNPLLSKHGVFVVPDVLERVTDQRTTSKGSIMFEVNLHVRFTFFGAGGDSVTASTWGEGTDMGDKSTNKAMTMAFKNVLNQAFSISNKEASDADAETPQESVARGAQARSKPAGRTWGEWRNGMDALGVREPQEWLRQAVQATTGEDSLKALDSVKQAEISGRANVVLTALEAADLTGPETTLGYVEDARVRDAFAEAFDGVILDGPEVPAATPPIEDDDIPFGE